MENLTTPLISSLIGAIVAAVGVAINNTLSFRTKIDENLRQVRLEVYKELWQKTGLLPNWPKATDVSYEKLNNLSKECRDWYFGQGGIYLSKRARKAYEGVQTAICQRVEANVDNPTKLITPEDYTLIQKRCSALRTELTNDLQSRKRAFLIGS